LVAFAGSCSRNPISTLDAMIASVETATTAGGASVVARSPAERTSISARYSWDVEVPSGGWADYRAAVEKALSRERFRKKAESDLETRLTREDDGDVEQLSLRLLAAAPSLRVRVTFTATAW
jgi:hypothetical protein